MMISVPKDYFDAHAPDRDAFIRNHAGQNVTLTPQGVDWASRRYFRVHAKNKSFILMETIPDHVPTATMGHKLSAFIKISEMLRARGIHAPEIFALDETAGYVLLEDFGDVSLSSALNRGDDALKIYGAATDVLIKMRDAFSPLDLCDMPTYTDSYIEKGRRRLVDWYVPATRLTRNSDDLLQSYLKAWDDVAAVLPPPPIGFMHGDFHLNNLMLLPDGSCGVLDFQDAMAGPVPYDLANLLMNIRLDVPHDVYDEMMKRYGGDDVFQAWFRVMAAQFHCRILGQVFRLAIVSGKNDLMVYIPRIQNYLIEGLKDPVLKPLAQWFADQKIDLTARDFNIDDIKRFVREDAF